MRRSLFNKTGLIDESMEVNPCSDYHTWLKVANISENFKYLPEALGVYMLHAGGTSQLDMSISYRYAIEGFTKLLTDFERTHIEKTLNYVHGRYALSKKDYINARSAFIKSISHSNKLIRIKSLCSLAYLYYAAKFKYGINYKSKLD